MKRILFVAAVVVLTACGTGGLPPLDVIVTGGRIYSLKWPDPEPTGVSAPQAPRGPNGWMPDVEALGIIGDRIVEAGNRDEVEKRKGPTTRVIDLKGATAIPGLVDSHVHLANLGASLDRVNLVGVETEAEAVERVVARAASVPKGEWIAGWGWDEGAWTTRLPTMKLLSERVPDHPVILHGLHTFAVWGNRLAFERARITRATTAPVGGEIRKDATGSPTGVLLNNAGSLLAAAVPQPSPAQLADRVLKAITAMVEAGYVSVHEAGADAALLAAIEDLAARKVLPIPVEVMLAARDRPLMDAWATRGPLFASGNIAVRGVKAFYDGAMGSRGAFFLRPYADRPDHSGVGGAAYGFDRNLIASMMKAGFQASIHAIGDRANREALNLFEEVMRESPAARETRPRIEHAQVLSAGDIARFGTIGVIASMQPSHAVEDMAWAQDRIGAERLSGAYAWRSLRMAGARIALNSDLPATDYNIFYGLHSAVTRTDRQGQPSGGWRKEQALTIEEALRGWTIWSAYAQFREQELGALVPGHLASLTVMDIDPFDVGEKNPARLLAGKVVMTIVGGEIKYQRPGLQARRSR